MIPAHLSEFHLSPCCSLAQANLQIRSTESIFDIFNKVKQESVKHMGYGCYCMKSFVATGPAVDDQDRSVFSHSVHECSTCTDEGENMKLQITSLFMLLTNCVLAAATCLHKAPYDIDVVGLTQEQCQ
uniref:Uncharacterized protein n=1 Tax=Cynoglossus semilaevis TaxID=244447 RepID=A0A3P8X3X9_CYNSE